jgi:hypothetical protein
MDDLRHFVMHFRSCLLLPDINTTDSAQSVYMGQRYNADKQCQLMYGPESFYCGVRLEWLYLVTNRLKVRYILEECEK